MTIGEWLVNTTADLEFASKTPRLDALLLLELVTARSRADLLASSKETLSVMRQGKLKKIVERRLNGEPMAYIAGQKEFYGRDFMVNHSVLVPRPESEAFLELLGALRKTERVHTLIDIGTGSGILAITAKLQHPDLYVFASDTSKDALQVAAQNALRHKAAVTFKEQNLLAGDREGYDVIFANLPYVPTRQEPDRSIAQEPPEALFSGPDGLEHYRRLFSQLKPKHIRFVMTESLTEQHAAVEQLAADAGYQKTSTEGLVQWFTKIVPDRF